MTSTPGDPQDPNDPSAQRPEEPGYWQSEGRQPESSQPEGWQPESWQPAQGPGGPQPPQPPGGYGYPPPPGAYPAQGPVQYAPDHPRATTVLVLGILGVVLCQVLGPFAWVMGKRAMNEIDASQGRIGGRGAAQAGYVLGIIGTVLLGVTLLILVAYLVFAVALIGGGIATSA